MKMPNMLTVYTITTSRGEEISLSAKDEWHAKQLFLASFPRDRISSIKSVEDPASDV